MTDGLFSDDSTATPPAPVKKAPKLYPIYRGARVAKCTGERCSKTVYWDVRYKFPLSTDCAGGVAPTPGQDGVGCSHFTDCIDVGTFSGRGKRGDR